MERYRSSNRNGMKLEQTVLSLYDMDEATIGPSSYPPPSKVPFYVHMESLKKAMRFGRSRSKPETPKLHSNENKDFLDVKSSSKNAKRREHKSKKEGDKENGLTSQEGDILDEYSPRTPRPKSSEKKQRSKEKDKEVDFTRDRDIFVFNVLSRFIENHAFDEYIYRSSASNFEKQTAEIKQLILSGKRFEFYGVRVCCAALLELITSFPEELITTPFIDYLNTRSDYKCKALKKYVSPKAHAFWECLLEHLENLIMNKRMSLSQAVSCFGKALGSSVASKFEALLEDRTSPKFTYLEKLSMLERAISEISEEEQYQYWEELLVQEDLIMINVLRECGIKLSDQLKFAQSLIYLFETKGITLHLIYHFIHEEAEMAEGETTLFRGNSMSTKMVQVFLQLHGNAYLKKTLSKVIDAACFSSMNLETDPERVTVSKHQKKEQVAQQNLEQLKKVTQLVLDTITTSVNTFPLQLKQLCYCITQATKSRFPHLFHQTLGSFIFLRYLCPALISPQSYGLVDTTPSEQGLRNLTLISKQLQSINIRAKEPQTPGAKLIHEFLDSITNCKESIPDYSPALILPSVKRESLEFLIDLTKRNITQIKEILNRKVKSTDDPFLKLYDFLKSVLKERQRLHQMQAKDKDDKKEEEATLDVRPSRSVTHSSGSSSRRRHTYTTSVKDDFVIEENIKL